MIHPIQKPTPIPLFHYKSFPGSDLSCSTSQCMLAEPLPLQQEMGAEEQESLYFSRFLSLSALVVLSVKQEIIVRLCSTQPRPGMKNIGQMQGKRSNRWDPQHPLVLSDKSMALPSQNQQSFGPEDAHAPGCLHSAFISSSGFRHPGSVLNADQSVDKTIRRGKKATHPDEFKRYLPELFHWTQGC